MGYIQSRVERLEELAKEEHVDKNPEIFEELFDDMCIDKINYYDSEDAKKEHKETLKMVKQYKENVPNHKPYGKKWLFENGYGISVIRKYGSCGYEEELFEIAVIECDKKPINIGRLHIIRDEAHLTYDTPITDDVLGFLTSVEVLKTGIEIYRLK